MKRRSTRRRRRRKTIEESQWKVDSDDEEWVPSKMRKAMKIVLVKRRPVTDSDSEDEDVPQKSWKRNHHSWLVRERENQDENRLLAELKHEADNQKREERRRARNLVMTNSQERMLRFHKENWLKAQKTGLSSQGRGLILKKQLTSSADATAVSPADGHSTAIDGEDRLQLHQGDDKP